MGGGAARTEVVADGLHQRQLWSFRNNLLWESRSACFTHEIPEDHYTTDESGLTTMNTEEIHEPGLSGSPPLTTNQLWALAQAMAPSQKIACYIYTKGIRVMVDGYRDCYNPQASNKEGRYVL